MTKDIALDENFDVFIDDRNDLGLVEGRREVEQSIALHLSLYYFENIGDTNQSKAQEKLKLQARRTAKENSRIDSLSSVVVEEKSDEPNVYEVTISYDESDFSFEVP